MADDPQDQQKPVELQELPKPVPGVPAEKGERSERNDSRRPVQLPRHSHRSTRRSDRS